jgi:flagellar protein FliO/FliZ
MQALTFFLAFVAVLGLIALFAWLVRRFAGSRIGTTTARGRMPRLAVIDAAAVDGRRRLVLVRRDNIEHLLMIGGPTDIVVEANIVRAMQRPTASAEPPPRMAQPSEPGSWTEADTPRPEALDHPEPQMPEPPPRPGRSSFAEDLRRLTPTLSERRGNDPLSGFTPEPMGGRPEPRPELRSEPTIPPRVTPRSEPVLPRPSRPSETPKPRPIRSAERPPERVLVTPPPPPPTAPPPALSAADQNLAEMAQRLEAALRRPPGEAAEPRVGAPPVAPEPPPVRNPPRNETPAAPPPAPPAAGPAAAPKSGFENLEDEMASLLGRPKPPS